MSEVISETHSSDDGKPKSSLRKCISLLKVAKTDTERFAALMLVTQLVSSNEVDVAGRRELFDAIGFKFLNRLLSTRNVPNGCPPDVYQSLSLTILACFATDEELCSHSEMINKIPMLLTTIKAAGRNESAIADDCYQILASFAGSSTGIRHLVEMGAISKLCEVLEEKYSKNAIEILLRILYNEPRVLWREQRDDLLGVLSTLSRLFKETQDSSKFELCNFLVLFLSGAEKSTFDGQEDHPWLANINKALKDILQSRISSSQRDPSLILISIIIDLVGMDWMVTFSGQDSQGLFILSLTIASVEIRMILDGKTSEEIEPRAIVLTSCYNILEKAINFAIVQTHTKSHLPSIVSGGLSKVYSLATEAMHSIGLYLDQVAQHDVRGRRTGQNRVVVASVRILCAWMSEETSALQEDVGKLLPFLLKIGEESLTTEFKLWFQDERKDATISSEKDISASLPDLENLIGHHSATRYDIMRFMLPPLCHLSADDKMRKIFVENNGLELLSKYFFHHWNSWYGQTNGVTDDNESETCLITMLGIFLNILVTEPELSTKAEALKEIGKHALLSSSQLLFRDRNITILVNLVVLGLLFVKCHKDRGKTVSFDQLEVSVFLKNSIQILKEARYPTTGKTQGDPGDRKTELATHCRDFWDDISELWFLGIQVLFSLAGSMSVAKELLEESGCYEEFVNIVNQTNKEEENPGDKN